MDAKNRLVLPLEIREKLGIEKNEKILISISSAQENFIKIRIAKANGEEKEVLFSKNGGVKYE